MYISVWAGAMRPGAMGRGTGRRIKRGKPKRSSSRNRKRVFFFFLKIRNAFPVLPLFITPDDDRPSSERFDDTYRSQRCSHMIRSKYTVYSLDFLEK